MSPQWTSSVEVLMTRSTEDQRFSASCRHDFDPERLLAALIFREVFECSDMMHLNAVCEQGCSALLTDLCQQSLL